MRQQKQQKQQQFSCTMSLLMTLSVLFLVLSTTMSFVPTRTTTTTTTTTTFRTATFQRHNIIQRIDTNNNNNNQVSVSISSSSSSSSRPLIICNMNSSSNDNDNDNNIRRRRFSPRRLIQKVRQRGGGIEGIIKKKKNKYRRRCVAVATALLTISSTTSIMKPANAANSGTLSVTEKILEKTSSDVDTIIDRYVEKHMFDDDTNDIITNTYKEAYQDATIGQYPNTIKQIITNELKQQGLVEDTSSSTIDKTKNNIGTILTDIVTIIHKRTGVSENTAGLLLAVTFVIGGPTIFLLTGVVISTISKRNLNKVFKERYGDTYTVDATIKQDDVIEAPPDDDDDEDDEDDDDDDDDDEDEKSQQKKK